LSQWRRKEGRKKISILRSACKHIALKNVSSINFEKSLHTKKGSIIWTFDQNQEYKNPSKTISFPIDLLKLFDLVKIPIVLFQFWKS
jgi:hypothetical protein